MKKDILWPAIGLIKKFEGLYLSPYICPAGEPTIGWGSIWGKDGRRVTMQHPSINGDEAAALLHRDIRPAYNAVARLINVPLLDCQAAALVDFTYNLGSGNLRASTLRAVINREEYDDAPIQLRRWVRGGGRVLKGLVRRRNAEIQLWNA